MQTPHKLGISTSALSQVTCNGLSEMLQWWKTVRFPATPTEMQIQSFGLCLPGVLVAPAAPSVVSGWWVLSCPGFSAVCRVPSWDQWVLPQGEERCWGRYYSVLSCWVSLCFPLPSSTSFLEIVTPNGSDVGHLLWLFPFFFFTFLQFTLPISTRRRRNAFSVWKADREMVAFALWVKGIIWHSACGGEKAAEL